LFQYEAMGKGAVDGPPETRDGIRKAICDAFPSLRVWALPSPTDAPKRPPTKGPVSTALPVAIPIDGAKGATSGILPTAKAVAPSVAGEVKLPATFSQAAAALRRALALQLTQPHTVNGQLLFAPDVEDIMALLCEVINGGRLPFAPAEVLQEVATRHARLVGSHLDAWVKQQPASLETDAPPTAVAVKTDCKGMQQDCKSRLKREVRFLPRAEYTWVKRETMQRIDDTLARVAKAVEAERRLRELLREHELWVKEVAAALDWEPMEPPAGLRQLLATHARELEAKLERRRGSSDARERLAAALQKGDHKLTSKNDDKALASRAWKAQAKAAAWWVLDRVLEDLQQDLQQAGDLSPDRTDQEDGGGSPSISFKGGYYRGPDGHSLARRR
jgi:hypothetical protein